MNDNEQEKVLVSEEQQDVTILNAQGELESLGMVHTRIYEGENVQRHHFESFEKVYALGPTSQQWQFVNHSAAMQPLMDQGWELKTSTLGRGGLDLHSIWIDPSGPRFPDPINWDQEFWPGGASAGGISPTIIMTSAIRPGKGIRFRQGYFRQICSNGLVSELMGLTSAFFTHRTWDADALVEQLFGTDIPALIDSGPYIGNMNGLVRFVELLNRATDEDESEMPTLLPYFVEDMLSPLTNLPNWFTTKAIAQFTAMVNADNNVYALDVVNAFTNAISLGVQEEDRAAMKPLQRIPSLTRNASKLIGILSL